MPKKLTSVVVEFNRRQHSKSDDPLSSGRLPHSLSKMSWVIFSKSRNIDDRLVTKMLCNEPVKLLETLDNNSILPTVVLLGLSVGVGVTANAGASLHDEIYQ